MKRMISFLLAIVLFAGLMLTGAPTVFAASEMTVSDALVEVLKQEEGFSAKPYWDYGQWTVGYGTKCPQEKLKQYQTYGIPEEDAIRAATYNPACAIGAEKQIFRPMT